MKTRPTRRRMTSTTMIAISRPMRVLLTLAPLALSANAASGQWMAPASANSKANPLSADQTAKGQQIFSTACFSCHGTSGAGDGPAGLALPTRPTNLTDPAMWRQSDGSLFWKIRTGKTPMPTFAAAYSESDVWSLVNYIRTLAPGRPSATADAGNGVADADTAEVADTGGISLLDGAASFITRLSPPPIGNFASFGLGQSKFLLTGFAQTRFTNLSDESSEWDASISPVLLWKLADNILFESEVEFEFEEGTNTTVALDYAQLSFIVNDYVTLGVGKFLNPSNYYAERLHPAWISKLPDSPFVAGHDGIIAPSKMGLQLRGGVPLGNSKFTYATYLSSAPTLVVGDTEKNEDGHPSDPSEGGEEGGHDSAEIGSLDYDNFDNFNGNLAVGGRVGFQVLPDLEVGYGAEVAQVDPASLNVGSINAVTQSVDINYVSNSDLLQGTIDWRTQLVWRNIDNPGIESLDYANRSRGGYSQLAYRPTGFGGDMLRSLELVGRYDWLTPPGGSEGATDVTRWTVGLNYWIDARTVLKAAYQFGERTSSDESERYEGIVFQASIGF